MVRVHVCKRVCHLRFTGVDEEMMEMMEMILTAAQRVDSGIGQGISAVRRVSVHGGVSGHGVGVDDLGGGSGDQSHGDGEQQLKKI